MRPLKEKVSLTLDGDIILKMKDIAEEQDRSLSQCINLILRKYLSQREAKEQK